MIGEMVSYYEVLELAGSGGMGKVFRARDRRLGRQVALKILHPGKIEDSRQRRRLLREARAYSAVSHPRVVVVYDIGSDRGYDFIAMEWVSGRPLAEVLLEGRMSVDRALELARQLADALVAVHDAGIVHRDLKPQNVMIDDQGDVKLLDFGIAKTDGTLDVTTAAGTVSSWTREGFTPGTVLYMSPEQARGEEVDERSDIFSFGVVLYEMLTAARPFHGETFPAFVHRLLMTMPESPRRLRDDVPEALAALVLKTLEKKPEDRFKEMKALAEELRKLAPDAELDTAPVPDREAVRSKPRTVSSHRPRQLVLLGLLLACLLIVGGVIPESRSLLDSSTPFGNRAKNGAAGEEEPSNVPELPPTPYELYQEGLLFLERYDREGYINAAIDRFERSIESSPEYAPAHVGLSTSYWRQFRAKRDPIWLKKAEQSARRALELEPLLSDAAVALARIKILERSRAEAKAQLEEIRTTNPGSWKAIAGLAEIALLEGKIEASIGLYTRAVELQPRNWELHGELGRAHTKNGDFHAAEAAFRKSIEIAPDNAFARRNLGAVLHYMGLYEEAVTELQESITVQPTARAYANLGTAYFFQGLYREAAAAFEAARDLGANYYLIWSNLGDAYRQLPEMHSEAISCFERAIQLLRPTMTDDPPKPILQSRLALYLAKAEQPSQALAAIALVEPLDSKPADIAYRATVVYELAGDRDRALHALEAALEGGYPPVEILNDPELIDLREEVAFHQLMVRFDPSEGR